MYTAYWHLSEQPFQNVADPRFAYLSDQHHEGLARLIYLVNSRKLGGVLTGAYGVGKSMILELLAHQIRSEARSRYLCVEVLPDETRGLARQLLAFIGQPRPIEDMTSAIEAVRAVCHDPRAAFQHTVLAIDEAHLIKSDSFFDFLHMLTNISVRGRDLAPQHAAFTLILSGHMDLKKKMESFESLSQRMQLVWNLEPLTETQTLEYIHHRIRTAKGDIWLFEEDAVKMIYQVSRGIPRLINNLCDVGLMLGCVSNASKIGKDIVQQAVNDTLSPSGGMPQLEGAVP